MFFEPRPPKNKLPREEWMANGGGARGWVKVTRSNEASNYQLVDDAAAVVTPADSGASSGAAFFLTGPGVRLYKVCREVPIASQPFHRVSGVVNGGCTKGGRRDENASGGEAR